MRNYPLPELGPLTCARQTFPRTAVADVPGELQRQLQASGVAVRPGGRYAIAVGSRGIAGLRTLVRGIVQWVKDQGASPFLVPAMGSHGGATAEGQRAVLESYGITEDAMGAPVVSSMDVIELPRGGLEVESCMDRHAAAADGTILLNRVKIHTDYHGPVESGLMKMAVIGLGKHRQAIAIHQRQIRGLVELLPQVARNILRHGNIILGVAVVENGYDQTALLKAIPAARIADEEPALLDLSRQLMPRLPVEDLDILIVDEIGKDISGIGMDCNIIGRMRVYGFPEPQSPRVKILIARGLTPASHGNAIGVGLADIITRGLYEKIDWDATYENLITNGFLERGKIPVVAETDRQAMAIAWRSALCKPPEELRLARIANTLHLEQLLVTEAVARELSGRPGVELGPQRATWFNEKGDLEPLGW